MAGRAPAEPAPTLLGIDETRFDRPRWRQTPEGRWVLSGRGRPASSTCPGAQGLLAQVDTLTAPIRDYVEHGNANARPFTRTATAEEVLAWVAWVQTNVQQLAANNAN